MNWIKYEIHTTTQAVEYIGNILYEFGIPGFEITDKVPLTKEEEDLMYTDIPRDLGEDDGSSLITFYIQENAEDIEAAFFSTGSSLRDEELLTPVSHNNPEDFIQRLTESIIELQSFCNFPFPQITYSTKDDEEWKDKWKDHFKPFRVAEDIIVKPAWEALPSYATSQDIILEIDPGSAFGTGSHETTKLCLLSLRKYITEESRILDAGCGSGILAICALLCGAKSAFCLDIDPSAVEGTKENASLNHLDHTRIQAVHGNILEDTSSIRALCPKPFQIVVANILADVIIPLADCIGDFIEPDGLFISSGILLEKGDEVESALRKNHFHIIEKNVLGDWVSFVAKK